MMTYLNGSLPPLRVSSRRATVLTLAAGEERANTDLRLRLVPAVRVSGTVTGPDGPVRNMGVQLLPQGIDDFSSSDSGMEIASSATDASGNFTMFGVPPGTYLLRATRIPRPAPVQSRNMTTVKVTTNGVIVGMELIIGAGSRSCPSHRSHAVRTSAADGCVGRSERGESDVAYRAAHLRASGIRGDQTSASAGPDPANMDLGDANLRRHGHPDAHRAQTR